MSKKQKRKTNKKRIYSKKTPGKKHSVSILDLNRVEFHRNALALMPDPADKRPGIAMRADAPNGQRGHRSCNCSIAKSKTCAHLKELSHMALALHEKLEGTSLMEDFKSSIWHRLAGIMADGCRETLETIRLTASWYQKKKVIEVLNRHGERILIYFSQNPDSTRFLERCTVAPEDSDVPTRAMVIQRLSLLTMTENERKLVNLGMQTRRQALEENFWYRFAYHCYREYASDGCTFHALIEEKSGAFVVACKNPDSQKVFSMEVPREKVKRVLYGFEKILTNHHGLTIHPIPLDTIFDVKLNDALDVEIRPLLRLIQKNGEFNFFDREDLTRYQYGDLIYIKELGILAEDQYPKAPPEKFREPIKTVIKKSQVPSFLEEFKKDLKKDLYRVDEKIQRLKIFDRFEKIEISPEAIDRDWCWLSVNYGTGNQSVSLVEILRAKQKGQRFIGTDNGWVDCQSPDFDPLGGLFDTVSVDRYADTSEQIKLRRSDIFRIFASGEKSLSLTGDKDRVDVIKKMLELKPSTPLPQVKGMTSPLRAYQTIGTEWLWFLFENGFGGLLCDDMGLGKTHQIMALMLCLMDQKKITQPFLVVCPTTVISHWHRKIHEHAPGLKPAIYHGDQRDFKTSLDEGNVVLTSYGVLRRDVDKFKDVSFSIAVFDEIQHIKNPDTQAYKAAEAVRSQIKLGLTGTPIENTLSELKALMDLTVPGYLGTSKNFYDCYTQPIEENLNNSKRKELSRLISPFTLRRLKKTVLTELPDKIEDVRTCILSQDQVKLYRDAIDSRAVGLLDVLENKEEPLPYMHIFALLNLLKQICNHPALVEKNVSGYMRYQSGKWELFTELLAESLDSGQKVVVFSQYLGMIEIIKNHLQSQNVPFVSLTGASRNRGQIISRFNDDPDCRMFVGSLKAGGTGIDLVAASVVIHYDRWWNAAREDQATDRVHRIGQTRGVQIFKLVTEGTLEEKIAAIIDKKRNLMDTILQEDNPHLLKTFSRDELIDMLTMPGSG